MDGQQSALRKRLGIPDDAERVLVFGETSHWDPNWLQSSEGYYSNRIKQVMDEVIDELEREPRRIFSAECVFFLRLYWERQPEQRESLRRLMENGQLRLTGTGLTTPDTLLPETEAILRDYLLGQQWLRAQGIDHEPRLAYLPDDFGHSPALPSLLQALGYTQACITRIDGMHFVGCDYRLPSAYPLPDSSAAYLQKDLKTLDFVWRAPDGAEVLCHWNAFTYFQGDMLAHLGIMRWMGGVMSVPWRNAGHVRRQIKGFIRQLTPLSRTPYLFCPIGCDFNGPIPNLVELIDRFNAQCYADTGVWVVNAAMEDYFDLVEPYRAELPVLDLDPNPYWMGFYATRPRVKRLCKELTHKLLLAERLLAAGERRGKRRPDDELASAWDLIAISNHHDFITGTSPDPTYLGEQLPWLREATAHVGRALDALRPKSAQRQPTGLRPEKRQLPRWQRRGERIEVQTQHYRLEFSEDLGGCIVALQQHGAPWIYGPSNDIWVYKDSGGLWRMGQEFWGGVFRPIGRASDRAASIRVFERPGELELRVERTLADQRFVRWLYLRDDCPLIRARISGTAPRGTSVTCRFDTLLRARALATDVPGGALERPLRKLYDPTFWAARSFAHLRDAQTDRGLVAMLSGPAAVSAPPSGDLRGEIPETGVLEWIALRNATRERAFGVLPILAHPASGTDDARHIFEYVITTTAGGDFRQNALARRAQEVYQREWIGERELGESPVIMDETDRAFVGALKHAERGSGLIARLERMTAEPCTVTLHGHRRPLQRAWLCDARERDIESLPLEGDSVEVPLRYALTSVRLQLAERRIIEGRAPTVERRRPRPRG